MAQEFKGKYSTPKPGEVVTGAEVQIFPGKQKAYSGLMANLSSKPFSGTIYLYYYLQSF